ncbi:hypothetical protein BpHYR1_038827 [Brachionus plicatilis]|uniref:Uncharacterized protein n=1 Tax=Brachionus plicatilis TaxID=10195 RepID=A0A3M7SAW6_BRAPC|nr:hypothetical protein BpHYR1_038827 [Brachionus plicatilis]
MNELGHSINCSNIKEYCFRAASLVSAGQIFDHFFLLFIPIIFWNSPRSKYPVSSEYSFFPVASKIGYFKKIQNSHQNKYLYGSKANKRIFSFYSNKKKVA